MNKFDKCVAYIKKQKFSADDLTELSSEIMNLLLDAEDEEQAEVSRKRRGISGKGRK